MPIARLADALPLMADVALRPTFPNEELERLRQERLTGILQARDNPATINATAFNRVLYGADASLRNVRQRHRRDDRRRSPPTTCAPFTPRHFNRRNSSLLVVGDVTMDKALPLLESSFGGWKAQGPAAAAGRAARAAAELADAHDLSRRQAGRAAVADPHRLDRRAARRRLTTFRSR